ncbi:MAG: hypothetical protein ACE5FN_07115 [Leptospirillia bacterium]
MRGVIKKLLAVVGLTALPFLGLAAPAHAAVFDLSAESGTISAPDGAQLYMWGFTTAGGDFRYPGPVLTVNEGEVVTVNLTNNLPDTDGAGPNAADPVSMLFTGQENVQISRDGGATWNPVLPAFQTDGERGSLRSMSSDALPGETVSYKFTATHPGTFSYYSGTMPHKHVDMGLIGALVVRPTTWQTGDPAMPYRAYNTTGSEYQYEVIQLYSAVDPSQHARVQRGLPYQHLAYLPEYWFINGRSFPDTLAGNNVGYLTSQPMGALIAMYPGERILMRLVTFDQDLHPLHSHGNHAFVVGRNGRPLSSDGINGDLVIEEYTQVIHPGDSQDSIFTWDAPNEDFGFDIYGLDPAAPSPVDVLPLDNAPNTRLMWGELYSGSPYLGQSADLPPGDAAVNMNQMGEMYVPFHTHHEIELQNQGEGPGGMLTLIMICDPAGPCPHSPTP